MHATQADRSHDSEDPQLALSTGNFVSVSVEGLDGMQRIRRLRHDGELHVLLR
jgi:hypothetical protein